MQDLKALLIIAAFYGGMQLIGITCPIKWVTGISCAGCGMTRAWLSFLLGKGLKAALAYHPLFFMVIPALALYLLRRRLPESAGRLLLLSLVLALLILWIRRMLDPADTIVVFRPQDGLLPRLLRFIAERADVTLPDWFYL